MTSSQSGVGDVKSEEPEPESVDFGSDSTAHVSGSRSALDFIKLAIMMRIFLKYTLL